MKLIDANDFKNAIFSAFEKLNEKKEEVNSLNVFPVPDGDTGTNMTMTVKSAVKSISEIKTNSVSEIAKALSQGSLMGARGNSGVILSQLFRGMYKALKDKDKIGPNEIKDSFIKAKETAYKAVMKPTEGTILTVASKMSDEALNKYSEDIEVDKYLYYIYLEGYKALKNTPNQLPVLKEAGVVDSGGQGLIYLFEGALNFLNNNLSTDKKEIEINQNNDFNNILNDKKISEVNSSYSVEFNLDLNLKIDEFKEKLSEISTDSKIEGDLGTLKIKTFTENPGKVIDLGLKLGNISNIEINSFNRKEDDNLDVNLNKKEELKEYGFIAVSSGTGYDDVFRSLNFDEIITGGQTMNPSTEDIFKSTEKINAKNIFIFPNNKNIILAAKQVKDLSEKNIFVIETTSIPQAFSVILSFDSTLSPEENYNIMTDALANVKVCDITFSVKDTSISGRKINKGDIIGLIDGKIIENGNNIEGVTLKTVEKSIQEDTSLITVFYGKDIKKEEAENLIDSLKGKYKDFDFELIFGGQPLYYYAISIE
ncbi:MAG: DAK2 domain-containing protein [Peptoniphilaceae bacterium]|nr:DAK2 domain-containing protein [Peptoniphilaceae bacterium]